MKKIIAIILSLTIVLSCGGLTVFAAGASGVAETAGSTIAKGFYNALNNIVETLVSLICKIYPNPADGQSLSEYNGEEVGFMPGRETYRTEAADGAYWSLGYASRSVLPEDVDEGKYNLGRDLTNKIAQGVYDDVLPLSTTTAVRVP